MSCFGNEWSRDEHRKMRISTECKFRLHSVLFYFSRLNDRKEAINSSLNLNISGQERDFSNFLMACTTSALGLSSKPKKKEIR